MLEGEKVEGEVVVENKKVELVCLHLHTDSYFSCSFIKLLLPSSVSMARITVAPPRQCRLRQRWSGWTTACYH